MRRGARPCHNLSVFDNPFPDRTMGRYRGDGSQVLTSPCAAVGSRTGKERGNNFSQSVATMRLGEGKMGFLRRKVPDPLYSDPSAQRVE